MASTFDGQVLTEKLSKLNSSQQSIEKLSHWCITHRKKAKRIVETWDKLYNSSQREQRLSFLYLANDIIQNSRRKGSEFVNEFWKVLPTALKDVSENGDDNGKKAVSRLVDIWEERKVFGSRGRSLKDEILARDLPPTVENNIKSSNPIKKVKKEAPSIRIKLALGSMPEQIVSAFQLVLDEHFSEDTALNNCESAVRRVGTMEKDFNNACAQENQQLSTLGNELQEQENTLQQCIEKLESAETARTALVTQLKEALLDQESKLELIRVQLKAGRAQFEQASKMRKLFSSNSVSAPTPPGTMILQSDVSLTESCAPPRIQTTTAAPETPVSQPVTSFATSVTDREEENKRVTAAAVAAKLTASASSLQMFSSVLSSLVAEEAASKNVGQKASRFATSSPMFSPEKRPKLENPMPVPDMGNMTYFGHLQEQQSLSAVTSASSSQVSPAQAGMHPMFQGPYLVRPPFTSPPPLPPQPVHQYRQPANGMPPLPPHPLPTHMGTGLQLANNAPQQRPLQQQQQPASQGYYQPMGSGFYGQNHQPTPPPVPPQ